MLEENQESLRPLGLILLTALYLFFFLVTASTFGSPFPLLGRIYGGSTAKVLVFIDTIVTLYLFLGLVKRQLLTWYLLIAYNLFEIGNTIVNLRGISMAELEAFIGVRVDRQALLNRNLAAALVLLLLTQFIYRHKSYFCNRHKYLF